jgi:hypothetical protein
VKLSGDLLLLGFEKNIQDECVFNRVVNGKQQTLVVHVDAMLITAENEEAVDNIIKQIGEKYNNLSIYRGRKLDYLGMTFFRIGGFGVLDVEAHPLGVGVSDVG